MAKFSDIEYSVLDNYVRAVMDRLVSGKFSPVEAREAIMHPLTAYDKGNAQGFVPYMDMMLNKWIRED